MSVCHVYAMPQRPEDDIGSPGPEVVGDHANAGAGDQTQVFCKSRVLPPHLHFHITVCLLNFSFSVSALIHFPSCCIKIL